MITGFDHTVTSYLFDDGVRAPLSCSEPGLGYCDWKPSAEIYWRAGFNASFLMMLNFEFYVLSLILTSDLNNYAKNIDTKLRRPEEREYKTISRICFIVQTILPYIQALDARGLFWLQLTTDVVGKLSGELILEIFDKCTEFCMFYLC